MANHTAAVPDPPIPIPGTRWAILQTPDAKIYFHNYATAVSTWSRPFDLQHRSDIDNIILGIMERKRKMEMERQAQEKEIERANARKPDRRPVCANPVPGSSWCVVWTGDNKVFYFNTVTRVSVWERPRELYYRPDVDMLISSPPAKKTPKPADVAVAPECKPEPEMQVSPANTSEKSPNVGEGSDHDSDNLPPMKRMRLESDSDKSEASASGKVQKLLEDPAVQAEIQAQKLRAELPLTERLDRFKEMLEEKNVDPTSTFERELSKIVFEERYLLLSAVERRAAFESFAKKKIQEKRDREQKILDENKPRFEALMVEAGVHSRSSFSNFARRYGKDDRFKALETMREREKLFIKYTDKMYEKERAERRMKKEKACEDFKALLKETVTNAKKRNDGKINWVEIQTILEKDARYSNKYLSESRKEEIFDDFMNDTIE